MAARALGMALVGGHEFSEFALRVSEEDLGTGFVQLQLRMTLRAGFSACTVQWGDGTSERAAGYEIAHNYTRSGRYFVRIGPEAKWWRLWACVRAEGRVLVSVKPEIVPQTWSDLLESCEGTYCGWRGVKGSPIPWGASLTDARCCYQGCPGLKGSIPPWRDSMTDVAGAFGGCTGLVCRVPQWSERVVSVASCYEGCTGLYGTLPRFPDGVRKTSRCYMDCTGLTGTLPGWPYYCEEADETYRGCTGVRGDIPAWKPSMRAASMCYMGCTGLTGAWTRETGVLMPEERFGVRCFDVVTGASEELRSLFWDDPWGGLVPRPGRKA